MSQSMEPKAGRRRRRTALLLLLGVAASGCRRAEPAPFGRVAFVRGDSLFVQALPDGQARVLAVGRALASPRWSGTGGWVAFLQGDSLRLERSDGSGGQTLAGGHPDAFAWAPTDDRLAYVAGGNLVVARAGGMAVALAERGREAAVEGVAWSADGQWLAYALRPTPAAPPSARATLWRIPARGGTAGAVPLPPVPFVGAPLLRGWTPDGGRVLALLPAGDLRTGSVASGGAPLYALPLAGGAPERLADSVLAYPDFVAPQPRAGGSALAFVAGGGEATWRNKTIVVVRPGAAGRSVLSTLGRAAISPAWSPDGTRLAWAGMAELPLTGGVDAAVALQSRRVIVGAPDDGQAHWLGGPPGRQEQPRWCADGRHLLVANVAASGRASLWLVTDGDAGREVVGPLAPPAGAADWNGTWGHVAWDEIVDYWPGLPGRDGATSPRQ